MIDEEKRALKISMEMWEWLSKKPRRFKFEVPKKIRLKYNKFMAYADKETILNEYSCTLCSVWGCPGMSPSLWGDKNICPLWERKICGHVKDLRLPFWQWENCSGILKQEKAKIIYEALCDAYKEAYGETKEEVQ